MRLLTSFRFSIWISSLGVNRGSCQGEIGEIGRSKGTNRNTNYKAFPNSSKNRFPKAGRLASSRFRLWLLGHLAFPKVQRVQDAQIALLPRALRVPMGKGLALLESALRNLGDSRIGPRTPGRRMRKTCRTRLPRFRGVPEQSRPGLEGSSTQFRLSISSPAMLRRHRGYRDPLGIRLDGKECSRY